MLICVAQASLGQHKTYEGDVVVVAPGPASARTVYAVDEGWNGTLGFVVRLNPSVQEGSAYRVRTLSGLPLTNFDVYFYRALGGLDPDSSDICFQSPDEPVSPSEDTGTVHCEAKWAVVVLASGGDARFRLHI